jgi:hypothetical protein
MGAQEDALILEYINAFQAVNTINTPPEIEYSGDGSRSKRRDHIGENIGARKLK